MKIHTSRYAEPGDAARAYLARYDRRGAVRARRTRPSDIARPAAPAAVVAAKGAPASAPEPPVDRPAVKHIAITWTHAGRAAAGLPSHGAQCSCGQYQSRWCYTGWAALDAVTAHQDAKRRATAVVRNVPPAHVRRRTVTA